MPSVQNTERLAEIKEDLTDIQAMWVVDYRGLTVKQSEQLRVSIREAGAIMKVHKNKLVRLVLKELDMPEMDEVLAGPSAFVFAAGDPVASAKALKDFAKANENLVIKGGIMDGAFVDAEAVEKIAALPSREELIAKLLGSLRILWSRPYACSMVQWKHLHVAYRLSQTRRMQLNFAAGAKRQTCSVIAAKVPRGITPAVQAA